MRTTVCSFPFIQRRIDRTTNLKVAFAPTARKIRANPIQSSYLERQEHSNLSTTAALKAAAPPTGRKTGRSPSSAPTSGGKNNSNLSPTAALQSATHSMGAPCSRQRTWAEKSGRSPSIALRLGGKNNSNLSPAAALKAAAPRRAEKPDAAHPLLLHRGKNNIISPRRPHSQAPRPRRVPHVRASVRGPKNPGEAHPTLLPREARRRL